MSRIAVFGGGGFLGVNLCKALRKKGHDVISIDKRNGMDILNWNDEIENYIKNCDLCFHLAAIPAHRLSVEDPYDVIYNNYIVTLNIAQACSFYQKKLIYASSFSVYGKQEVPWTEDMPLQSDTPYAHAKVACEDLLRLFSKLYGANIIITRFSNVYGEHEELHQPIQVLPIWFKAYKEGKPIKVMGETTTRDWTYVGDVVNALLILMDQDGFDVFNICRGKEISLMNIAKIFCDDIEVLPLPEYEAVRWVGDNSKMRSLGWKPMMEVEDYIEDKIIEGEFQ